MYETLFVVVMALFGSDGKTVSREMSVLPDSGEACFLAAGFMQVLDGKTRNVNVRQLRAYPGGYVFAENYTCPTVPVEKCWTFCGTPELAARNEWCGISCPGLPFPNAAKPNPVKRGLEILLDIAACETDCDVCHNSPAIAQRFLPCGDKLIGGVQSCREDCKR